MNDSKEHIIRVASKLFLNNSFKEVTMKEITNQTGLSKGAFYHYFESKEKLFCEVLDYLFNEVFVHNYDSYSKESFYQYYHDYIDGLCNFEVVFRQKFKDISKGNEKVLNYFALIYDALKLFPSFSEQIQSKIDDEINHWKVIVKIAQDNSEITTLMTDAEIAKIFVAICDGIGSQLLIRGKTIKEIASNILILWDKLYITIKSK